MTEQSLLAYTVIAAAVVVMPGADTILVLGVSLRDGRGAGIITALGVVCGPILWGALAGLGVAVLLGHNPLIFSAIAAAGGIYLCYLAARAFMRGLTDWRSQPDQPVEQASLVPALQTTSAYFGTGLMTNVLNPKIGVFYLSVMPGLFIGQHITVWLGALLGLIHATIGFAFLAGVSALSDLASRRLTNPRTGATIDVACGLCLLSFGIYVLARTTLPPVID